MNAEKREIDVLIRAALAKADEDSTAELGRDSVLRDALAVFTGRNRWLNIESLVVGAIFFGLAIYSAIRFMGSRDLDLHGMLVWGFSAFFCLGVLAAMKIWYWLELQRITLARELKRLELQVVQLAQVIEKQRD